MAQKLLVAVVEKAVNEYNEKRRVKENEEDCADGGGIDRLQVALNISTLSTLSTLSTHISAYFAMKSTVRTYMIQWTFFALPAMRFTSV